MIFYAYYDHGISCKFLFNETIWFLCILWSWNILQVFVQWENIIFYLFYDQGIFIKPLFDGEYDFLCILWSWNILQIFVQWENIIFYLFYDQGIFYKSLFNERIWFLMHIMTKEYSASLCSMRKHDFLCILWSRNILQVFVQWENMIFYKYYDQGISCKSLFHERIWFFMHIMTEEYSASLCSMREYDFLCILWLRNILQVFVQWENTIFYAYYDHGISCKCFFKERICFFMHIMVKIYSASLFSMREFDFLCVWWCSNILQVFVQWEIMIFLRMLMQQYSASLCSMREYDFLCILWLRNILQVFVQWEIMIFYAYADAAIFCKSLFHERIWFFMHIMIKEYSASLCSMREYDFLCILWLKNILQVFVQWENMMFYAYDDAAIFCKCLFNERLWFFMRMLMQQYSASLCSMREYDYLCILWLRNILQVFVR
jgi:hypothetical protein